MCCVEQFLNVRVFTEISKYTHIHWILKWFLSISKQANLLLTAGSIYSNKLHAVTHRGNPEVSFHTIIRL